jgi:hypothetical protein
LHCAHADYLKGRTASPNVDGLIAVELSEEGLQIYGLIDIGAGPIAELFANATENFVLL